MCPRGQGRPRELYLWCPDLPKFFERKIEQKFSDLNAPFMILGIFDVTVPFVLGNKILKISSAD